MLLVVLICFDDHAAVSGDAVHLAQCGMLRASPDASGTPARQVLWRIARAAAWTSMLRVEQWPQNTTFSIPLP
jgi:hypothetical protein